MLAAQLAKSKRNSFPQVPTLSDCVPPPQVEIEEQIRSLHPTCHAAKSSGKVCGSFCV